MTAMTTASTPAGFDAAKARFNMIEQQIRPWDVADSAVLALLDSVPRDAFVGEAHRALAYADLSLPTSASAKEGEAMLQPKVQARMVQDAAVQATDTVLHVGTGTGFMAALLGKQAQSVTSIEINPALADQARANLKAVGITNVEVVTADATAQDFKACQAKAPYDVIMLSGSMAEVPQALLSMLKPGGRLVAIVGNEPVMRVHVITRTSATGFATAQPWDYTAARLVNFPQTPGFQF
ncbi:protein-L-isoaspartate O-methyltransferase family protein [Hydrogenophaga soli]